MIDKGMRDLVEDLLPPGAVLEAVSVEFSRKSPGLRIEATYSVPSDEVGFPRITELPVLQMIGGMLASMLGVTDLSPVGHQDTEDWFPRDGY